MLKNSADAWGLVSKLFHWVAAALIVALLIHGWTMTHLVPRGLRLANYSWHAAIGYDLLALTVLRALWRWLAGAPKEIEGLTSLERLGARLGHWALYGLTFAACLTGWALAGTLRRPLDAKLFGVIDLPALASPGNRGLHDALEEAHEVLVYGLALFVVGHVVAAVRHHVVKKNAVLTRMTFARKAPALTPGD